MILPPWAYAAAAGLTLATGFAAGWKVESWRWSAAEARDLAKQQQAFNEQLAKQNNESKTYEQDREKARVANESRQEQVRTIYRTVPAPGADCAPPDSVRSVLNEAVTAANQSAGKPGAAVPASASATGSAARSR